MNSHSAAAARTFAASIIAALLGLVAAHASASDASAAPQSLTKQDTGSPKEKSTSQKAARQKAELPLEYIADIEAWHEKMETSLRRDNGWLTLAGRFIMKPGINTFGTGKNNDIVFPPELAGVGPERLGTLTVANGKVTLNLDIGIAMKSDGKLFTGERSMGTDSGKRDWVSLDYLAMHIIERNGTFVLRLADNQSAVRKNFPGRIWYPTNRKFLVDAKYVPYPEGRTISIVNIIDEVSDEPCPGYVEFKLNGKKYKLDVIGEDDGLFFVIRDGTAGKTTYRPSRFLFVDKKPAPNTTFKLDFNKAYNPPCAFSDFTTCPLPPTQNIMQVKIEAGELYRKH